MYLYKVHVAPGNAGGSIGFQFMKTPEIPQNNHLRYGTKTNHCFY